MSEKYRKWWLIIILIAALVSAVVIIRKPQSPIVIKPGNSNLDSIYIVTRQQKNNEIIMEITGRARGVWFFEASFPIVLTDGEDKVIIESHAEALSEWMTVDFVPFRAVLSYRQQNAGGHGFLTLKKDNPSGLPEHDDSFTAWISLP